MMIIGMTKKSVLRSLLHIIMPVIFVFLGACESEEQYYSMEDFQSVEKIDTHVHINVEESPIIEQAEEDNFHVITVNTPSDNFSINELKEIAVQLKDQYPEQVSFLTSLPLENWNDQELWEQNASEYLQESMDDGAVGVKVWKNIGLEFRDEDGNFVMIDDPQFDPIFEFMAEQQFPLLGHIGEPRNTWLPLDEMTVNNDREYFEENPEYHMYLHDEYPSYWEIITSLNNFLEKNPELPYIGAHLASMEWSIDMMAEHLDNHPNLVLDFAHRVPHLQYLAQQDRERLRDFMINYQDRFVYSTDLMHYIDDEYDEVEELVYNTWRDEWEFFVTDNTMEAWQVEGEFQGLKLPKEVIDKIYRENALELFDI